MEEVVTREKASPSLTPYVIKQSWRDSFAVRLVQIFTWFANQFLYIATYPLITLLFRLNRKLPASPNEYNPVDIKAGADRSLRSGLPGSTAQILKTTKVKNFLTVDVECWFHAYNVQRVVPAGSWDRQETRIVKTMERLLLILEKHDAKATFFVLGWVADRFPEVVRMIDQGGHELATHGSNHKLVTLMTPEEFETDLLKSVEAINRHSSQQIIGHRASNFTVVQETLWALEILARNGFQYDSSIFPISRQRYGIKSYPRRYPHRILMPDGGSLFELPLSTLRMGERLLPMAGGGYFRLYPLQLTAAFIERLNLWGLPAMVYLHPWEFKPEQTRYYLGPLETFQHYVNLETTGQKLERLLNRFSFTSVKEGLLALPKPMLEQPIRLIDLYGKPQIPGNNTEFFDKMPR